MDSQCVDCERVLKWTRALRCPSCRLRRLADCARARKRGQPRPPGPSVSYRSVKQIQDGLVERPRCSECKIRVARIDYGTKCDHCQAEARRVKLLTGQTMGTRVLPSSPVTRLGLAEVLAASKKRCPRCGGCVLVNFDGRNRAVYASCLLCAEIVLDMATGYHVPEAGRMEG